MSEKVCFPICYGRGRCRVTIYNRTTALPYYRISYQIGSIRHQRTFKTLKDAKAYAKEVSAKLKSDDIISEIADRFFGRDIRCRV
ncbi:MAG: hypothetical protein QF406_06995 [Verrucomicrobiota bacterium]|jgi:hypothetical protein|nr:hypothetical protein [Verrucomicrobiota bacterium]